MCVWVPCNGLASVQGAPCLVLSEMPPPFDPDQDNQSEVGWIFKLKDRISEFNSELNSEFNSVNVITLTAFGCAIKPFEA